jgi:hypothetical protein
MGQFSEPSHERKILVNFEMQEIRPWNKLFDRGLPGLSKPRNFL